MTAADGLTVERMPLAELMEEAAALRDRGHGRLISYSRKVFIPLTKLCRDVCHYCTFAEQPGGVHYGSPDKQPAVRLETIRVAGELRVPFTTGILIGIGETRAERLESLRAIADLHAVHGHIQEVIVQNFRAKPRTKRANYAEPDLDDLLWTIAAARMILGAAMNIQAPPNLSPGVYQRLIDAGLNDWGGISSVTPDHVNPDAPWPAISAPP